MEIPPSLIQASIPPTFLAPTLKSRILVTTIASTITSDTIQTIPLYVSTLIGNTIQANTIYSSTITSNNIVVNTLSNSSLIGSVFQSDTLIGSSLIGNVIQTNNLYGSLLVGSTIQTNTAATSTLLCSTIQINTLLASSVIGSTIQANTLQISTLIGSTIQANILKASMIQGSSIQPNTIRVSTIIGSTFQTNQMNTNMAIGSTLFTNTFLLERLQFSTLMGSTIQATTTNISTLLLEGSTFQTNKFNFNTIVGNKIQVYEIHPSTLLGSSIICSTIQLDTVNCSTMIDSTIQLTQLNISTLSGSTIQTRQISVPTVQCSTLQGNTVQTRQLNGSTLFNSTIQTSTLAFSSIIGSTIQTNILQVSSLSGSSIQTNILQVSTLSGSSIQINILQVSSLSGSTIQTTQLNLSTLQCNTIQSLILHGSTIIGSTIQTSTLVANTIRNSTIIASTIQTDTLQVSSMIYSTIIGGFFDTNMILITDGNKALSTSAINATQLSYLTNITSQVGGIGQTNTWTATQTFSVSPVLNGLSITSPSYLLGTNASNQLVQFAPQAGMQGSVLTNYIPYASGPSTLNTSIMNRVSGSEIIIGQIPTVMGEWMTFDLGTGANYHNLFRMSYSGKTTPNSIHFLGSDDNITWISLGISTSPDPFSYAQDYNYTLSNKRYIRLVILDMYNINGGSYGNSIMLTSVSISYNGQTNLFVDVNQISVSPNIIIDTTRNWSMYFLEIFSALYTKNGYRTIGIYTGSEFTNYTVFTPDNVIGRPSVVNIAGLPQVINSIAEIGQTVRNINIAGDWITFDLGTVTNYHNTFSYNNNNGYTAINKAAFCGSNDNMTWMYLGVDTGSSGVGYGNYNYKLSNYRYLRMIIIEIYHRNDGSNPPNVEIRIPNPSIFNGGAYVLNSIYANSIVSPTLSKGDAWSVSLMKVITTGYTISGDYNNSYNTIGTYIGQQYTDATEIVNSPPYTLSVSGLTQATNVIADTGTFSKIDMPDKRSGLNGTQMIGNQGCNFYMGTMNNNGTGNYTDTLYLNSGPTVDTSDSFNVKNNIVVTSAGAGFVTMPSFTLSSTSLTISALIMITTINDNNPALLYVIQLEVDMNNALNTLNNNIYQRNTYPGIYYRGFETGTSIAERQRLNNLVIASQADYDAKLALYNAEVAKIKYLGMPGQWARIFDMGNLSQAPTRNFDIAFNSNGTLHFEYRAADDTLTTIDTTIQLVLNTMYHIVWSIDTSGYHVMYINGQQVATMIKVISIDTYPYFYLGKSNWSADPYPNMTIYDFRMMNRSLSMTEVQALYVYIKTINQPILSGQYIELNRPNGDYLNLAEIQVFSYPGGPNIASSTSVSFPDLHSSYLISNFTDGNFNTMIHSIGTNNSTVTINLGSTKPIYKIVIYNRIDCCWNRANGIVLTIKNSSNTIVYTASPIPNKLGRTTIQTGDAGNLTSFYYTFTYFPPYAAVIGDFEKIADPCKVNVVMFNKGTPGMRIYQGIDDSPINYSVYKDLIAYSDNLLFGQNSDTIGITFGPSATTPCYLKVGAGTNRAGTNVSQIISTNGNLHLDCASNAKTLFLNKSVSGSDSVIFSYTPWTHTGNLTVTGNITVRLGITTPDWYYISSDKGMYWTTYDRGFCSPEQAGTSFGTVNTYNTGRNGWTGWGVGSKACMMTGIEAPNSSNGNHPNYIKTGIHDNVNSWVIWYNDDKYADDTSNVKWGNASTWLGGGSARVSQGKKQVITGTTNESVYFMVYFNGSNDTGGIFYVKGAGVYGKTSDERIKKNIKQIDTEQSISFIRGIIPSYFCLKQEPFPQLDASGKETGQMYSVCNCIQSGFIAQNVLESAKKAGLPQSTVSNSYEYEQELSLPEEERKTLLGLGTVPLLSHSYNALKGTMKKQDMQHTQIDEISNKCLMIDTGLTALQEIVRQNADLLQKLLTKA